MKNPRQLLDAVKTADDIHKGDFSSLRGKSFVVCVNMKKKKRRGRLVKKKTSRLDRIEMSIAKLAQEMRDGFKQVNTRLDYIVSANNLKDLPQSKKI